MEKKKFGLKFVLTVVIGIGTLLFNAPFILPANADKQGSIFDWSKKQNQAYGYLIAYSSRSQVVYYTPIFSQPAPKNSFDDEEYVSQPQTISRLEAAFLKHLEQSHAINRVDFTINARPVFKTETIAQNRFYRETDPFRLRGFDLLEVAGFSP